MAGLNITYVGYVVLGNVEGLDDTETSLGRTLVGFLESKPITSTSAAIFDEGAVLDAKQ